MTGIPLCPSLHYCFLLHDFENHEIDIKHTILKLLVSAKPKFNHNILSDLEIQSDAMDVSWPNDIDSDYLGLQQPRQTYL